MVPAAGKTGFLAALAFLTRVCMAPAIVLSVGTITASTWVSICWETWFKSFLLEME